MSFTYRYTGDVPTAFITIQKNGHTWVPSKDDTIKWPYPLAHPLLEEVIKEAVPARSADKATVPAVPETKESPGSVDLPNKEN
jgi:hypothetical protein